MKSVPSTENLEWHDRTCSQTTEVGLIQLLEEMKNGEIAVLFRNNHYLTVTKQKDKLFSLVTDQGYLEAKNVIWEEINFSGGGDFYNENFVTRQEAIAEQTARDAQIAQQVSKDDEKLARQLQQQEQERYRRTNQRAASNQRANQQMDPVMYQQHLQQQRLQQDRKDKCSIM